VQQDEVQQDYRGATEWEIKVQQNDRGAVQQEDRGATG